MPEQKIKFKVTLKELSFEFEGAREVGQVVQAGLNNSIGRLIDTQRTVMALPGEKPVAAEPLNGFDASATPAQNSHHVNGQTIEKAKRRKTGGPSLVGQLRELKTEGFFKEERTVESIV